jgi:hypothetical protein
MNLSNIRRACIAFGIEEPISIEPDGTVWTGSDDDRTYPDMKPILAKADKLEEIRNTARETALTKLAALGLTDDEINALLGL